MYQHPWAALEPNHYESNAAGYLCWGANSAPYDAYATNGYVSWSGGSGWWLIETIESFNGLRDNSGSLQGCFVQWFSPRAFGGTNYENTPIGAVGHVDEPGNDEWNEPRLYFGMWQQGKCFAALAWYSLRTTKGMVVGDPFIKK